MLVNGMASWCIHLFFSSRCLEMLLQVQWQRNFLTSCSLLLKCHDWWWLKFDGEPRISPQVLIVWGTGLGFMKSESVRMLWAASHSSCAGSGFRALQQKCVCSHFFWLRQRERAVWSFPPWAVALGELAWRAWVMEKAEFHTLDNSCQRVKFYHLPEEGDQEMSVIAAGSCLRCLSVIFYPSDMLTSPKRAVLISCCWNILRCKITASPTLGPAPLEEC